VTEEVLNRFKSMKFNPFRDPTQTIDKVYKDLFRYEEFLELRKYRNWERLVNYILLLYSKDTVLLDDYQDNLKQRKDAAAEAAGYKRNNSGDWPEEIKLVMEIRQKPAVEAILCFLRHQKSVIWREICISEEELYNFQMLRFNPIEMGTKKVKKKRNEPGEEDTGEVDEVTMMKERQKEVYEAAGKKDNLLDACKTRISHLESLYVQFYGDSRKELMEAEFSEMITPEKASRMLSEMEAPYQEVDSV
jgi:hypothetical protein